MRNQRSLPVLLAAWLMRLTSARDLLPEDAHMYECFGNGTNKSNTADCIEVMVEWEIVEGMPAVDEWRPQRYRRGTDLPEDDICVCAQWNHVETCRASSENSTECGTQSAEIFTARYGHALTVHDDKLWVVGGKSNRYKRWDLESTNRMADVWYSRDGKLWVQKSALNGEFSYENENAKFPGKVGPFWERFGHSLDSIKSRRLIYDGSYTDTEYPVLILAGGYAPEPMNDVWASEDGSDWHMVHGCPSVQDAHVLCRMAGWSPRGWHATTVFQEKLWVLGGAPLNNEVWAGSNMTRMMDEGTPVWNINWVRYGNTSTVAWSPRAGLAAVSQFQYYTNERGGEITKEYLFVFGGFAGWDHDHSLSDGVKRARNDAYRTEDGLNWTRIDLKEDGSSYGAPWAARAFHSVVTWQFNDDLPYMDVTKSAYLDGHKYFMSNKGLENYEERRSLIYEATKDDNGNNKYAETLKTALKSTDMEDSTVELAPRMWLSGGAYFGSSGASEVLSDGLMGYMDLWWSRDGSHWYQVNHQEGEKDAMYTSCQAFKTEIDEEEIYLGKYGHQMIQFQPKDSNVSALFFVAGATTTTVDTAFEEIGGALVNDVFVSSNGILCEIEGKTCSGNGICAAADNGNDENEPATFPFIVGDDDEARPDPYFELGSDELQNYQYIGCACYPGFIGEYCEGIQSAAFGLSVGWFPLTLVMLTSCVLWMRPVLAV